MKICEILKIADFFTLANLIFGLLSIFYSINKQFTSAAIFLLITVVFDFLDGKIARFSKKVTEQGRAFGKELDSLADVVSFGVAPAIFGFSQGLQSWWEVLILLFFVSAGMLRLSRFNITINLGYYEGMPITFNGIIFPVLYFISLNFPYPIEYNLIAYAILGFLMLSSKKLKKLKR